MTKHLGVIGLDEFNSRYLSDYLNDAEDVSFFELLSREETAITEDGFPFEERLELANRRIRERDEPTHGVLTYWDFPSSSLAPLIAREWGLPYASPESVLLCEHKLWCREEQANVIETPAFCGFDPFADDPLSDITLDFPFWIKPVVGFSSMLGFNIESKEDFEKALPEIRDNIEELAKPFQYMLDTVRLSEERRQQKATQCIAEQIISERFQCTLEGYMYDGECAIYGAIDSIRHPNAHTFSHYQYPSTIDRDALRKMEDMAERLLRQIGYDNCAFNVEFFYDPESSHIWLLEVNPRISQSHSELFLDVDDQPNQQVSVDLALGRKPRWRKGDGRYRCAAKFFMRKFHDARVEKVPGERQFDRLVREMPEARVQIHVDKGTVLSEMPEQESYSYDIADVFIGAQDEDELLDKYHRCQELLTFEFEENTETTGD